MLASATLSGSGECHKLKKGVRNSAVERQLCGMSGLYGLSAPAP